MKLIRALFLVAILSPLCFAEQKPYIFSIIPQKEDRLFKYQVDTTFTEVYDKLGTKVDTYSDQTIDGAKTFSDGATLFNCIMPAGFEMQYISTVPPAGYNVFFEDGRSLLRADYPDLFAAIGTTHGAADSMHFNIPDCRGRFNRGVANGSTLDPDRATRTAMATGGATGDNVGSVQSDEIEKHYHTYATATGKDGVAQSGSGATPLWYGLDQTPYGGLTGGNETRPTNRNVAYFIKY